MKKDKIKPWSLIEQGFCTLILSGPLLWFVINLKEKKYDDLKINIPFAIISFIILDSNMDNLYKIKYFKKENSSKRYI